MRQCCCEVEPFLAFADIGLQLRYRYCSFQSNTGMFLAARALKKAGDGSGFVLDFRLDPVLKETNTDPKHLIIWDGQKIHPR